VETGRDTMKCIRQINVGSIKDFGVIGLKFWCFDAAIKYGIVV